jgi:hypothetical protein
MEASNSSFGNASTDFYSSTGTTNYPNIEIIRNPNSFLVSKLTATINVSKYQDFRYRGFVSNYFGTVGFYSFYQKQLVFVRFRYKKFGQLSIMNQLSRC